MIDTDYKVLERKHGRILVDAEDYEWIVRDYRVYVHHQRHRGGYLQVLCARPGRHSTRKTLARVILGCDDKKLEVDHINHDTLDNRKSNLRIVSRALNATNRRGFGASLYKGVNIYEGRNPYRGQFKLEGKNHIGKVRATEEAAALDYNRMCIMAWGHQSILNEVRCMSEFPEPRDGNCPTCHAVCYCCCVCSDEMTGTMQRLAELMEQGVTQTAC